MTVDVVVLVVDRCLAGIGTELHALLSTPGREALLQIGAGGFVALLLGSRVERGVGRAISPSSLNSYEVSR